MVGRRPAGEAAVGRGGLAIASVTDGGRAGPGDRIVPLASRRIPGADERRRRVRRGSSVTSMSVTSTGSAIGARASAVQRASRGPAALSAGSVERP